VAASIAFSKFRPKNDYGAFDLEQAVNDLKDAKLYPELAGKPDLLKAAETQLKDLYNTWKLSVNERDRERLGKIWTEVAKHKSPTSALAAVRKMNEWKQLDGTAQRTLTGQIENELHPPVVSAASKEKMKEAQDAKYFELTRDPARLAAMTEPEIMAMTPELGTANVEKAIKEKRRLATAAETVTIDKNHLHQRAKFAGMNVDNPTAKEKALLGDLWKRAQEIIYATQKGAMRPLDRKEKEKIFDTLLLIVPVRMKGGIFGADSISYENRRLFQVKDVGNVGRPGDRQKVIESFRAKGIEPDEDQILRGIAAMNKK